jgi:ribosomal protein S18 acetylase RimI-like enzyme
VNAIVLRAATPDDAIEVAAVHVAAWRTTYAGLVPQALHDRYNVFVPRVEMWRERLADPRQHAVVASLDGVVCGFSAVAPMPDRPHGKEPLPGFDAYLSSLYLLASVQRRGIGRRLLGATARVLRAGGSGALALHVLSTNPARRFYERLGATFVRDEPPDPESECLFESAYGWHDLAVLEAATR